MPAPDKNAYAPAHLIAAVSHEIRTPLNGILGMASLLAETELKPAQRDYVEAIRNSGERLLELLNNLLDYSRLQNAEEQSELAPFDPYTVIQEVVELMAPAAHANNIDIAAIAEAGDWRIGNSSAIQQIIFNLVGNAVKFTSSGAILVKADTTADNQLRLSIYDTGPGIDAKIQQNLFEPFVQLNAGSNTGGAGLGLAIVARLCETMHGAIRIDSQPDQGSIFHVELPLAAAPAKTAKIPDFSDCRICIDTPPASQLAIMAALAGSGMTITNPKDKDSANIAVLDAALPPAIIEQSTKMTRCLILLRPEDRAQLPKFRAMGAAGYLIRPLRRAAILDRLKLTLDGYEQNYQLKQNNRILIADDDPVNLLMARRALEAVGYQVDTATTGAEAVEAAAKTVYAVILMDVRMPVMDGLEATKLIRNMPDTNTQKTPIIAVTAEISPELERQAKKAGINKIATKPIDPQRLRSLTREQTETSLSSTQIWDD